MARINVEANRAWNQIIGRYSRAVLAGDLIETTATPAVTSEGEIIGKGRPLHSDSVCSRDHH